MKNILPKIVVIVLILLIDISIISAQESTTLQFMKGMPQSDLQNPALHNDSSLVVFSLPGMSGLSFSLNNGFAVNDLITKGTGAQSDSLVYNIYSFHDAIGKTNSIQQNLSMPLFYMGIWSKKSFFSFGITENIVTQFSFDKSLVKFIIDGNEPYMGQNYDLGNLNFNALHYREFALGYSNEVIKNKLTVGLKVKALYGKSAIQTERMNMKVETAADGSYLNLRTDMKINMSMPVTLDYDSVDYLSGTKNEDFEAVDYLRQTGNFGLAFDFGAVYKLNSKITLSGSIVDMGKISFKKDLNNIEKMADYKWEGIDVSKSIDDTKSDYVSLDDLFEEEADKMTDSFRPKKSDIGSEAFDASIPTKIYLGGTYQINDKFNIGLLDRLYKYRDISKNTVTLSANALLGNFFSLTGSYSMIDNSYNNLGLGAAFRLGFMQLYFVSDNLLVLADYTKVEFVNARIGMNFLIGRKHKVKIPETTEIQ